MNQKNLSDIDFDNFIKFLSPFHHLTTNEEKYAYLFRIYDIDEVKIYL
jgi:Ca2+-binding EF-hand superfamily protein